MRRRSFDLVNSSEITNRVLALRGYINLVRIRSRRPSRESIDMFLTAMDLATEPSEKRMVLAGLGDLWSVEAINVVAPYLDDPALRHEAEAAAFRLLDENYDEVRDTLEKESDGELKQSLSKILESSENPRLRTWISELPEESQTD